MSHLVSRILLASLIVPVALVIDMMILEFLDRFIPSPQELWAANLLTAAFIMACWSLLWRKRVTWTARRIALTCAALVPAAGGGAAVGGLVAAETLDEIGIIFGVLTLPLLWIFITVFIWRETSAERNARYGDNHAGVDPCPT